MSCNFVPKHIFQNILQKGNTEQKSLAADVLAFLTRFSKAKPNLPGSPFEIDGLDIPNDLWGKKKNREEWDGRKIYDSESKMVLQNKLVRSEGGASNGDKDADAAYDGSGKTYEFFKKMFGRNSIDDHGMALLSNVNYGKNFANAFWDGKQMTYGSGDFKIFNSFAQVLDVVSHEISHGVTERTAGLEYRDQSGALNEHFSDVFGILVKQYDRGHTAEQSDWLIGEGLFTSKVNARALRDMKNPGTAYDDPVIGKDNQPWHVRDYKKIEEDQGGVHRFSGIPNKCFQVLATSLGGHAWEKAGQIWYKTLTTELKKNSQFQDCANATTKVAGKMYGSNSIEQKAVVDAWNYVGIKAKK